MMLRNLASNGESTCRSCRITQFGTDLSEGETFGDLNEIDRARLGTGSNGLKLENRGAEYKMEE
jgi:hypothetical protein